MIEPSVLQLCSIGRIPLQSAIHQNIAGVHCVDFRLLSLAAEMLSVVSRDFFSSETHVIDPPLVWREKNKIRRKWDSGPRRKTLNDTAEIVNEKLLPQPGDCPIVLTGGMQRIRVVTGPTEAAENRVDTRPPAFEISNVHIDNRVRFRVQGVVHIDEDFPAG